ncbi:hypothetical protein V6N11_026499 [Hibiscus sabdariffa]|uniref:Uncharacterized protein n=1 Tax=Hibiscus sabdariffa TaxID=183260 RepID=A0ABR2SVV9_9ROSI
MANISKYLSKRESVKSSPNQSRAPKATAALRKLPMPITLSQTQRNRKVPFGFRHTVVKQTAWPPQNKPVGNPHQCELRGQPFSWEYHLAPHNLGIS